MREHGTSACYAWGPEPGCLPGRGCRCGPCTDARRQYDKTQRRREAPAYVAAGPVREHIAFLSTEGLGWKTVAHAAGLHPSVVWKIVYGPADRGPSKRVRHATAEKILAVTPADGADGSRIDAGPSWKIIRGLLAAGWTKAAISRAIGQDGKSLQLGTGQITRGNARAIAALEGQPPPAGVGSAWSKHHMATVEADSEEAVAPIDDRDRITLLLVELLEARIDQAKWRARAACTGKETWMFFPSRGDNKTVQAAKAVCATCPVQAECLAAHRGERDGIFGGLSARERRSAREHVA